MRRLILAVLLLAPAGTFAQDCADWSRTPQLPVHYPELRGSDILVHGEFVIVAGDSLLVSRLNDPDLTVVGRCDLPSSIMKLRVVHGNVYLCNGHGLHRVDLSDPEQPTLITVFYREEAVYDIAGIDGGAAVVAWGSNVYVVDGLDTDQFEVLGQTVHDRDISHVVAIGSVAYIGGERGIAAVNCANPGSPVIGARVFCEQDPPYNQEMKCIDLVLADGFVYATTRFIWHGGNPRPRPVDVIQAFDVSAPLAPTPWECIVVEKPIDHLGLVDGALVTASEFHFEMRSLPDLEVIAALGYPQRIFRPILTTHEGPLYFLDNLDGVWRWNPDPVTGVASVALLPDRYDPAGCGRFGIVTYVHSEYSGSWYHTDLYDQASPLNPVLIYSDVVQISEYHGLTTKLVAQNDRWAIVESQITEEQWSYRTVAVHNLAGDTFEIEAGDVHLAGDHLWLLVSDWGSVTVEAFDLSGDVPVALGVQDIGSGWAPQVIGDVLIVFGDRTVRAFDIAEPSAIRYLGELQLGGEAELQLQPRHIVSDGTMVYVASTLGIVVLEVRGDSDTPIAYRGNVDLGYSPGHLALQDDLIAVCNNVGYQRGWQIVSVADPKQPFAASDFIDFDVADGFVWSNESLYVGVSGTVFLYDVSDPAAPAFVGQAAAAISSSRPCLKGRLLMDGSRVLPLACVNISATGQLSPPLPEALVLHAVAPNPFNPRTTITFDVPRPDHVTVTIHDLRGRQLVSLADAPFPAGRHTLTWNGADDAGRPLPSGTYLVRLVTDTAIRTTKAVLIR